VLLRDIRPGTSSSGPTRLTGVNGTLFCRANDGTLGDELWKSDGTAAGTVLIDLVRGAGSSSPDYLANANGKLFFSATTPYTGREPWILPGDLVLGDMNGDDSLDNFDIAPFEQALVDEHNYYWQYHLPDYVVRGDVNGDGLFDNFDIAAFEALLAAGPGAANASAAPSSYSDRASEVAAAIDLVFSTTKVFEDHSLLQESRPIASPTHEEHRSGGTVASGGTVTSGDPATSGGAMPTDNTVERKDGLGDVAADDSELVKLPADLFEQELLVDDGKVP
jgi:ELWxxDGT repeat protein